VPRGEKLGKYCQRQEIPSLLSCHSHLINPILGQIIPWPDITLSEYQNWHDRAKKSEMGFLKPSGMNE
jgi:hypothetical protein